MITCTHEHETCKEINNRGVCVCPTLDSCPKDVKIVCGDDGKSYLNECIMKLEACKKKKRIIPLHDGVCGEYSIAFD